MLSLPHAMWVERTAYHEACDGARISSKVARLGGATEPPKPGFAVPRSNKMPLTEDV